MAMAKLYDKNGNSTGEMELPDSAFGITPNAGLVWQYVKVYLANQRVGTHSAKTRAEVAGGGKKPWRQKGTGRARQGTISSPIWRKGGVTFPPKPREHRLKFTKKMRKLALASILSDRANESRIHIFEKFDLPEAKTSICTEILENSNIEFKRPTLIITNSVEPTIVKSIRNIPSVKITHTGELNTYQVITAENIIIEKNALSKIEELCKL